MKYYADLHIHSALSPCASNEMTPNNIVNMAYIKGLDIIAVTDHNCMKNYPAVKACAEKAGILAIPGMEVETAEEVHVICLFPNEKKGFEIEDLIFQNLPDRKNSVEIFGDQYVFDEYDNVISVEERFLITAADIGIEELCRRVKNLGGIYIPAHIDRDSNSILSNLGDVPSEINPIYLEYYDKERLENILDERPNIGNFRFIKSSDAHYLGDILEPETFFDLEEKTVDCLLAHLSNL